jgi:hypothetical protein
VPAARAAAIAKTLSFVGIIPSAKHAKSGEAPSLQINSVYRSTFRAWRSPVSRHGSANESTESIWGASQASSHAGSRHVKDATSFVRASASIVTRTTFIFVSDPLLRAAGGSEATLPAAKGSMSRGAAGVRRRSIPQRHDRHGIPGQPDAPA